MSRSRRYTSIISNTSGGVSEKKDKQIANRNFRRVNNAIIQNSKSFDDLVDMLLIDKIEAVSDVWLFNKDGKQYIDKKSDYYEDKYMRK